MPTCGGRTRNLSFLNLIERVSGFSALVLAVVEGMLPWVVRRTPVFLFVVRVVPAAPHAVPNVVVDDEVGFPLNKFISLQRHSHGANPVLPMKANCCDFQVVLSLVL